MQHLSYEGFIKEIKANNVDTIQVTISLLLKSNLIDTIPVYAVNKPETLVGKTNYSIFDFDFYEDKLILLTAQKFSYQSANTAFNLRR